MISVAALRMRVQRLTARIVTLEERRETAIKAAADLRAEAGRIRDSISHATSSDGIRVKERAIKSKEENARVYGLRAARLGREIEWITKRFTDEQRRLRRAVARERSHEEAATRKRRAQELRSLHKAAASTGKASAEAAVSTDEVEAENRGSRAPDTFEYDVCLSFAGEDRAYVRMVADALKSHGVRVFYDEDEQVRLWGTDLQERLDYIYREASRYCVMFISDAYASKPWTRHERRSALARALEEEEEYVLPARIDDTELPGLPPSVAYVDLREFAPLTLVEFILDKLTLPSA